jgi:hypothetical protein
LKTGLNLDISASEYIIGSSHPKSHSGGGGDGGGGDDDDTPDRLGLMRQLLRYLPEELTNEKLAQWLRAAEMNLRITHDVPGEIKITVIKSTDDN